MTRGTRNLLVIALAVAVAGLASFAVYRTVQRMPVREVEVAHAYAVVSVKSLPVGTLISKDDVTLVAWPARNPVKDGFSAVDPVVGRGLVVPVAENEPITESKLAPREAGAGLPPTIKPGMRAISVKVNEVIGVAGFVVPGTHVDVVVSLGDQSRDGVARVVVSNVEVLTAGTKIDQDKARKDGQPIPTTVVTLMVTPADAEKIALAAAQGRIMLTLRNPLDVEPSKTTGIRLASLIGPPSPAPVEKNVKGRKVMVAQKPVVAPPTPPPPPDYTVETIRGAKKTVEVIK
jgi:pilus assembly protein CpaB